MTIAEYADYDGLGLAELVRTKAVKPIELVEMAIARAEQLNPQLNCIVFRDYERARATAQDDLPQGAFCGVPFFLKDAFGSAQGMPTRLASQFVPPIPGAHDCVLVARYKAAGLVILGKTNVPEFGLVPTTESKLYGPARNPWNLEHSTGGSSGGSAAAVAARIVPLAHANDGGGSIRVPASCCGLVGLKPTRARISFAPDCGEAFDGLVGHHVISRSVRDSAAALDATAGCLEGDPYWAPAPPLSYLDAVNARPKQLKIAVSTKTFDGRFLHPDCVAAVEAAATLCANLGHDVEDATPDFNQTALVPAFMAFWAGNLAAGIDRVAQLTGKTPTDQLFEGLTWGLYEAGQRVSASEYLRAKAVMQGAARSAAKFHATYDVWLTATLGTPPVKLGVFDMNERDPVKAFAPLIDYLPFAAMQNITGQPAINLPLFWNIAGLPIGVHFTGRYGDETTLLQLAGQLEKAAPWAYRKPPIGG